VLAKLAAHIDAAVILFGLLAAGAFWVAIQLCWSARGKRWYSIAARLAGVVVLVCFGIVMVFYTAFGADGN
jgi:hypothetical protein